MSRMLTNKKYYFAVEPTKSCPLSFPARWLYSFLVFRTSLNKPATEACIFRNCGFSNRGTKGYLGELREAGLVAETNGHYVASEPSVERWQWFVQKGKSEALPTAVGTMKPCPPYTVLGTITVICPGQAKV